MLISAVCIKLGLVDNLGWQFLWYEYGRQDILSIGFGVFMFSRSFCIIVSFDIGGEAVFNISTFLAVGWGRTEAVNNMFYEVDIFLSFFLLRAYIYRGRPFGLYQFFF